MNGLGEAALGAGSSRCSVIQVSDDVSYRRRHANALKRVEDVDR